MKKQTLGIVLVLVLLSNSSLFAAITWTEVGDAGDLPGTAQTTVGVGLTDLTDIFGTISSSSDQDMYLINIDNPAAFSASTNNPQTTLSVDHDTQLFLFDAHAS